MLETFYEIHVKNALEVTNFHLNMTRVEGFRVVDEHVDTATCLLESSNAEPVDSRETSSGIV